MQARGRIDDAFRAALKDAGAEIISYIPNNAYLVRASSGVAQNLGAGPAQSVLPFEPYYKLKVRRCSKWRSNNNPCRREPS